MRAALAELSQALDGLSSAAGDLTAGEARDTALQLRAVVGNAVACDSAMGRAILVADDTSADRASGTATAPRVGDTLWWRGPDDSVWTARRIVDVATATGACAAIGTLVRPLLHVAFASPDTVPRAAPLRLTRQMRYSVYRAGDGTWQLGVAEWSDVLHAFAPPQPVAGPFTRAAVQGVRTGFRYFGADGSELAAAEQGVEVARVARVRMTLVSAEPQADGPAAPLRRDSVDVGVQHAP